MSGLGSEPAQCEPRPYRVLANDKLISVPKTEHPTPFTHETPILVTSSLRTACYFVFLFVALFAALPAYAHPGGQSAVYHYLWVEARPGELSLQYASHVGELLAISEWSKIDRDDDGEASVAEQQRHAAELAAALPLRINGKRVPWKVDAVQYPAREPFFEGVFPEAALRIRLTAPLPAVPAAGLSLTLRDDTYPLFTAIFPQPVVKGFGITPGAFVALEDGRRNEIRLLPAGAKVPAGTETGAAPKGESAARPDPLPTLELTPEKLMGGGRGKNAARGNTLLPPGAGGGTGNSADASSGTASTGSADLANAPLFPGGARVLYAAPKSDSGEDALKGFLRQPVSPMLVVLALGAALLAGAAHALTPGHGKTMVGAYLVGSRGSVWDAVVLGIVVTITHTFSIYVLGFLCLWLTSWIRAEIVTTWLNLVSGVLVLGMGFWLFQRGLLAYHGLKPLPGHAHGEGGHTHGGHSHAAAPVHAHEPASHEHSHGHAHGAHDHGHSHAGAATGSAAPAEAGERRPPRDSPLDDYPAGSKTGKALGSDGSVLGRWGVVGLGIASGLVPCTDGLAILIAAVSLGRIQLGLAIIAAFSVGMAAVLVALGVLMVKAKDVMERFTGEGKWVRALPVASGGVLFFIGTALTLMALRALHGAGVLPFG